MTDYERECVEEALAIAEDLLMDTPLYDAASRVVPANSLLRIVQELNASLNTEEPNHG